MSGSTPTGSCDSMGIVMIPAHENRIRDRAYLVTGATGGVGPHVARAFGAAGARVLLTGRRESALERLSTELGGVPWHAADLADPEAATELAEWAERTGGGLDGLLHVAGAFAFGAVAESEPGRTLEAMLDANLRSLVHTVRAVLPAMRERGRGVIAGVAAAPALNGGTAGLAHYGAAKAGVANFLQALDAEVAGDGIRVTVLYPMGVIDTPDNRKAMPDADREGWLDPDELASALIFAATRGPRARVRELPVHPGG